MNGDTALDPGQRRPGAGVDAAAEGDVFANVLAVQVKLVGVSNLSRVAVGGPGRASDGARRDVDAARVVVLRASRKSTLVGLCMRSDSSMKAGISPRLSRRLAVGSGSFAQRLHGGAQQLGDGLLAGREQERGRPDDLQEFGGTEPSG